AVFDRDADLVESAGLAEEVLRGLGVEGGDDHAGVLRALGAVDEAAHETEVATTGWSDHSVRIADDEVLAIHRADVEREFVGAVGYLAFGRCELSQLPFGRSEVDTDGGRAERLDGFTVGREGNHRLGEQPTVGLSDS